ncbi:hypothetical protein B0H10DRAFT_1967220 [Mycena sp. CBHHK59/15]|nr:hypothetical protein B0H10DRAFT_1967220 [Mycena sp. CBHHK59/15]
MIHQAVRPLSAHNPLKPLTAMAKTPKLLSPSLLAPAPPPQPIRYSLDWPSNESDDGSDSNWDAQLYNEDGMKSAPASDIGSDMDVDGEDRDYCLDSVFLDEEVFLKKLLTQAEDVGDSVDKEEEWVPACVRYQQEHRKQEKKAQGSYKSGPDLGSKPACTKCHYKDQLAKQQNLNRFGFSVTHKPKQSSLQPKPRDFANDIPDINVGGAESDIDMLSVRSKRLTGSAAHTMSEARYYTFGCR